MALSENPTLEEIVDEVERLNNLIVSRGGAQTITPSTSNKTLNKGYYKGNITIKGDANLIAKNIVKGKTIFGVQGTVTTTNATSGVTIDFNKPGIVVTSGEYIGLNYLVGDRYIYYLSFYNSAEPPRANIIRYDTNTYTTTNLGSKSFAQRGAIVYNETTNEVAVLGGDISAGDNASKRCNEHKALNLSTNTITTLTNCPSNYGFYSSSNIAYNNQYWVYANANTLNVYNRGTNTFTNKTNVTGVVSQFLATSTNTEVYTNSATIKKHTVSSWTSTDIGASLGISSMNGKEQSMVVKSGYLYNFRSGSGIRRINLSSLAVEDNYAGYSSFDKAATFRCMLKGQEITFYEENVVSFID